MNRKLAIILIPALLLLFSCGQKKSRQPLIGFSDQSNSVRLFAGGFTGKTVNGLTLYDFDNSSGRLTHLAKFNVGPNPSYFCYSREKKLLYVANEVTEFRGRTGGGLTTYAYNDENISVDLQNEMIVPFGGPCYISLSPDSGHLFVANYPTGSIAVIKLNNEGIPALITDSIRYERIGDKVSHAHMIMNNPSGDRIYVSDLGLDRIIRYDFDEAAGKLLPADTLRVPEGFGPRHFVFSHDGSVLYIINELGSMITVFSLKNTEPELIQTLPTTKPDYKGDNYCADIHLSNDGKFLYGSNRGENSIVVFSVKTEGTLELAGRSSCGGNWPRNFTLDPSGEFLLVGNQKSDSIAVFRIGRETGIPVEPPVKYSVTAPACLKFY